MPTVHHSNHFENNVPGGKDNLVEKVEDNREVKYAVTQWPSPKIHLVCYVVRATQRGRKP